MSDAALREGHEPAAPAPAGWSADRDLADGGEQQPPWRTALLWGGLAFVASRIFVLAGAAAVGVVRADAKYRLLHVPKPKSVFGPMMEVLLSWDSRWYLEIIRHGYPHHVKPNITYAFEDTRGARAAFFPVYPKLVHYVDTVLPGGDSTAALFVSFVFGALFILLVGLLTRRLYGTAVAQRAMVLTSLFPGSFVLSWAYSEGIFLCFALLCLWALVEHRWELAGLAGLVATATRPNGVALVVACAVAAAMAIRDRREWRSLSAVLLAPIGLVGFHVFLAHHTGEWGVWFRIQREAWKEGYSFGFTAIKGILKFLGNPLGSPGAMLTTGTLALMVVMIVLARRTRLPIVMWVYSIAILVLMLMPDTVTARPRFLYTAFPLLIAVAARWRPNWTNAWTFVMMFGGAALVALNVVYGGFGAIP